MSMGHGGSRPFNLFRVFPPPESKPEAAPEPAQVEFRLRADLAEARIDDLKSVLNDVREGRDRWRSQAERPTQQPPRSGRR
jgi:hypothetical protein